MGESTAIRVLNAWARLETALRQALPSCAISPPTQPAELLSALRINRRIGPDEEERIRALREIRNRVAVHPEEPCVEDVERFEAEVDELVARL